MLPNSLLDCATVQLAGFLVKNALLAAEKGVVQLRMAAVMRYCLTIWISH
jgi:hypothetical protein